MKIKPFNPEARLCYIDSDAKFAYFTTQKLENQWGDDWNDAPYEHNAGEPYHPHDPEEETWQLFVVGYQGDFETPADIAGMNSPYSVQSINSGAAAWLTKRWSKPFVTIPAGVTIEEFKTLIEKGGGRIFLEVE